MKIRAVSSSCQLRPCGPLLDPCSSFSHSCRMCFFTHEQSSYVVDVHPSSPRRFSGNLPIEPHRFKNVLTSFLTVLLILLLLWVFFVLTILKETFVL